MSTAQLNPFTRQALKRGQRLPTADERSAAIQAEENPPGFPIRGKWAITDRSAIGWALDRRGGQLSGDSLAALTGNEFGLFLSDLDCFGDLCRRGIRTLDQAAEYLRPGRERWGMLGDLIDIWRQMREGGGAPAEVLAAVQAFIEDGGLTA